MPLLNRNKFKVKLISLLGRVGGVSYQLILSLRFIKYCAPAKVTEHLTPATLHHTVSQPSPHTPEHTIPSSPQEISIKQIDNTQGIN